MIINCPSTQRDILIYRKTLKHRGDYQSPDYKATFLRGDKKGMAFEGLSSRLQEITRKLSGKARINESDLKEVLREVKLALLEADVNYKVVKDFVKVIEEKALGADVLKSLTPGQQVVKIVRDELTSLLRRLREQSKLYSKSTNSNYVSSDYKVLVKLQQLENLQIELENKGKNHFLLPVMFIGQQLSSNYKL